MSRIRQRGAGDNFDARRRELPEGFRPDPRLRHYRTDDELVRALKAQPFGLPAPEALDLITDYGLEAVAGALIKVLADMSGRGRPIREPRALLVWSLKRGKAWSPEQVRVYLSGLLDDALERLAASANVTDQRLARELERAWGEAPANVISLERAQ